MDKFQLTSLFRQEAKSLGFEQIAFAQARELTEEARRLDAWLNKGYHGQMKYMENHFDKRIDPRKLVDGAKTVISLLFNYFPSSVQEDPEAPKIARYAYGKDYHYVLKHKLKALIGWLETHVGQISGRCFVDSAPVLERDWARHSGLGWIGKNTLLLSPQKGSYFFLAEIIVDLEFVYDNPIKDYCGTCTRCIDACPTEAIDKNGYWMDGSKCISYFTIELRDQLPKDMKGKFDNWAFGCDICQEVCPWNRFSKPHQEVDFQPHPELLSMKKEDWMELSEDVFRKVFKKSAVKRTKYKGLMRNLDFLKD